MLLSFGVLDVASELAGGEDVVRGECSLFVDHRGGDSLQLGNLYWLCIDSELVVAKAAARAEYSLSVDLRS